jgi:glycosyltransferase involved in cell wall biosynthesis
VRANGAVNAVAEEIAAPYREAGIPASVSPNYPLPAEGAAVTAALLQARSKGAIHIGTLSAPYGMERLLRLAAALSEDPADFTIDVVSRFPNAHSREEFEELFHRYGSPQNLRVIPAVPAHEIPGLLSEYRVGLSMLEDGGQNDIAIPTKLYEYVRAGLAIVGTDRAAQRRFLAEYGVGTLSDDDAELANALRAYLSGDTGVDSELERTAVEAQDAFNWNLVSKDVGELLQGIRRRRGA